MFAEISAWASAHAKLLALVVPLLLAGGAGTVEHVHTVNTRLDAVEERLDDDAVRYDHQLEQIRQYTSETRCMLVLMNTGEDPLECLNH